MSLTEEKPSSGFNGKKNGCQKFYPVAAEGMKFEHT